MNLWTVHLLPHPRSREPWHVRRRVERPPTSLWFFGALQMLVGLFWSKKLQKKMLNKPTESLSVSTWKSFKMVLRCFDCCFLFVFFPAGDLSSLTTSGRSGRSKRFSPPGELTFLGRYFMISYMIFLWAGRDANISQFEVYLTPVLPFMLRK